jgi:hypothetical protein
MLIPLPVPELWRENFSGFSKIDFFVTEGAQIAEDGKTVEHSMLPSEVKTGCQSNFLSRSYGEKILPGWPNWLKEHRWLTSSHEQNTFPDSQSMSSSAV